MVVGENVHELEPIRGSIVALVIRIATVLLFGDVSYALLSVFFLKIYFLNLELPFDLHHHSILILAISHVVKNFIQLYFIMLIASNWVSKTYFIINKQLIKRSGVFTNEEKIYDLKNIRSVIVRQSLVGKFFHYGDVTAETSASGGYMENVTLIEVADPQKYESKLLHSV